MSIAVIVGVGCVLILFLIYLFSGLRSTFRLVIHIILSFAVPTGLGVLAFLHTPIPPFIIVIFVIWGIYTSMRDSIKRYKGIRTHHRPTIIDNPHKYMSPAWREYEELKASREALERMADNSDR